mmetsp:Transcript_29747/g.44995  ORF Transcript_29747/g.44995 Transcript_29747/m.44995 type:complete len:92 (-) Transcript_29747:1211-1486(-)
MQTLYLHSYPSRQFRQTFYNSFEHQKHSGKNCVINVGKKNGAFIDDGKKHSNITTSLMSVKKHETRELHSGDNGTLNKSKMLLDNLSVQES